VTEPAGEPMTEFLNESLPPPVTDTIDVTDYAEEEPPLAAPPREGLPPSFRMRHDKHYVEELMSSPSERAGAYDARDRSARIAPRETVSDAAVPSPSPSRGVSAGAGALELIASRMEFAVAHASLARAPLAGSDLVAQSVQAEFKRIARLARAAAVLNREDPPWRRPAGAGEIAAAAQSAASHVARLSGVDVGVTVDEPGFTIAVERALLIQSIAGTVDALIDLLISDANRQRGIDEDCAPRIDVALHRVKIRPALIVDVACQALPLPAALAARFFDNRDDDYRAAPAAGILLAAAGHVVRLHRGRADVQRHNGRGVTVTYVFPQEEAAASL
jgi:hypothetical protein